MNINELSTYNLSDAVKFHNRLNPRLWDQDEQLKPEVREKLLEIAADFQEFLGVSDLEVEDITISGSNAAYSYTPHSDIDLHLVVRQPQQNDEVYQELFNAKKYQYNDQHNIRVRGSDVELYVQPADQKHVSLGVYSVLHDKWIDVPKRKRAKIDHNVVQHKYEDLKARIESALDDDDHKRIAALTDKIKEMRQAGLDAHGEFGPENLAFKMLRTQGLIKQLWDAKSAAKDRELSLKERNRQPERTTYGFAEDAGSTPDGVNPTTCMFLNEKANSENVIEEFIQDIAQTLHINNMPNIELHTTPEWSESEHSFGRYEPDTHTLHVSLPNRHILDIMRTTAHELCHCKQNEISELPYDAGSTGSDWENEAHAVAGIVMRNFANAHPEYFSMDNIEDEEIDEGSKSRLAAAAIAACLAAGGTGCSTVGQGLNTGRDIARSVISAKRMGMPGAREELGQELKNYARAQGGDANAQNQSHLYQLQRRQQNENASGYIPTKKQANDPRYKMALSVDVHPGEVGKQANKMSLKTDKQGKPALIMKTANLRESTLEESLRAELAQIKDKPARPTNPMNQRPTGPETPPKMPKGTIKVDVSDMYDWYKLGQKVSDLSSINKDELGKGPPSTVFAFGSEELENMYSHQLTNLGLKTHDLDEPGEEDVDENKKLLEYDRSKTVQNFGQKLVAVARRDVTIPQGVRDPKQVTDEQLTDVVISQIEQSDPTKNKEYSQALAKLYGNGGIKFEDMGSTVSEYLTKFHRLKQKKQIPSPRNDFMSYSNIGDFFSVVDEYPDPTGKEQQNKGSAKEVFNDADIRVIVPEDEPAACYYGQGTRWCTAGRTGNMFNAYNKQGPMYIILPKSPAYPGEKYQFHFESGQFMDELDHPEHLKEIVARHPSVKKAFAKQAEQFGEIDLMTPEQARPYVAANKKQFEADSKEIGKGVRSINVEDYNNETTGFSDARCRMVQAVTGKNLQNNAGLNIGWAGDHAWALVSTKTGEVQVVYTDMEGYDVYIQRSFDFEDAGWNTPPKDLAVLQAAEVLRDKLKWYMELNAAGDPDARGIEGYDDVDFDDDELNAANNAMAENPDADQEALNAIFAEYGQPANRKAGY